MANNISAPTTYIAIVGSNTLPTAGGGGGTTPLAPPTGGQLWPRGDNTTNS